MGGLNGTIHCMYDLIINSNINVIHANFLYIHFKKL
jgi:hypothetical protein